jgi:hypothetical protein
MSITLRPGAPTDAAICGPICYHAFKSINDAHNFPPDFPSPEIATGVLGMLLSHPNFYSVVAERDGKIVGSNFLSAVRLQESARSLSIQQSKTKPLAAA